MAGEQGPSGIQRSLRVDDVMADAEREDGNVAGARRLRVDRAQQPADADQGKWLQSGFGVMSTVVKEFSPFGLRPPRAIEC